MSETTIEPVMHRILVKPYDITEADELYKNAKKFGIDLSAADKIDREQAAVDGGYVEKIGPTAFKDFNCECPIEAGDEIVFAKYAGKNLEDPVTKQKFVAINDEDVIAIIRKGKVND